MGGAGQGGSLPHLSTGGTITFLHPSPESGAGQIAGRSVHVHLGAEDVSRQVLDGTGAQG